MYVQQTQWVVDQPRDRTTSSTWSRSATAWSSGDNGGNPVEWAERLGGLRSWSRTRPPGCPMAFPTGIAVGNHDQSPNGDPAGTTTFYNQYFGETHFTGRDLLRRPLRHEQRQPLRPVQRQRHGLHRHLLGVRPGAGRTGAGLGGEPAGQPIPPGAASSSATT